MALRIKLKTLLLLALLLLIPLFSAEGFEDGVNPKRSLHKDVTRKMMDAVLDYDDAGANPKHDPKRKPGSGGSSKNP